MVADCIGGTTIARLVRIRPTLVQRTVPREASFTFTLPVVRVGSNTDIAITTRHNAKVVRSTFRAGISAISKLEEGLWVPLPCGTPFGVAR